VTGESGDIPQVSPERDHTPFGSAAIALWSPPTQSAFLATLKPNKDQLWHDQRESTGA